jgi:ribosomal protein L37AE/L43A
MTIVTISGFPEAGGSEWLIGSDPDEPWFAFDFNKLCELCYCCGSELVQRGFASSIWFCGECRRLVEGLNEEHGRCVIPMGRFDQNDAVATLKSWTRLIVQDNLRVRRFVEGDAVPLGTYLEAVAAQPVDKPRAFDRFYGLLRPNADGIRSNILTAAGARGENHHSGKSQCREPD